MKRYLIFGGSDFYPGGGWLDFQSAHETLEEARAAVDRLDAYNREWWHITDVTTCLQVSSDIMEGKSKGPRPLSYKAKLRGNGLAKRSFG